MDLHAKVGYFAHEIGHLEFVVPMGPEGMAAESASAESDGTGVSSGTVSDVARRAHALAQRIVDTIEQAYAQGNDLQDELASTRQRLLDITAENHADIHDALRPASGTGRLGTDAESVGAGAGHLAAVAEAEDRLRSVNDRTATA